MTMKHDPDSLPPTEPIDALTHDFIEAVGEFGKELGLAHPGAARLFAYLILSDRALSQEELSQRLDLSRGHTSESLRMLLANGFIRKSWIKGTRKEHYEAEKDLWRVTAGVLLGKFKRQMSTVSQRFEDILKAAKALQSSENPPDTRRRARLLVDRVKRMRGLVQAARKLLEGVQLLINQHH